MDTKLVIIMLVTTVFSWSCNALATTGNELNLMLDKPIGSIEIATATGYIMGVTELNTSWCNPGTVTVGQMRAVVSKYFKDHPEKLHKDAFLLVGDAAKKAFPCK